MKTKVIMVGNPRETHVGRHLLNAAGAAGVEVEMLDLLEAYAGPRLLKSVFWHLLGKRPMRLERFSAGVLQRCSQMKPDLVLTTGIAPLSMAVVKRLRAMGVSTANFLTDDPWNKHHHTPWFMKALPHYDHVFTPRRANMPELRALIGPQVHYLPFAYAPEIHFPPEPMSDEERARWRSEVLFIGGADEDRASVMRSLQAHGFKLDLWGGYWNRTEGLEEFARGHAGPAEFRKLVVNAAVNLCLVRSANRDGHSMRSLELPAVGGCMVVEDTPEHRDLLGADGDCVRYFQDRHDLASQLRALLAAPSERARLSEAVRVRVREQNRNTYADRLQVICDVCVAGLPAL